MKIFLAGLSDKPYVNYSKCKYFLESFVYYKKWEDILIENKDNFLLDSGAFTYMNNSKENYNFEEYIRKYADFINKKDIKLFFELDIDSIVGIEEVERLRKLLEQLTNKKCIPVWHKSRGKDYFIKMCKEYNYVAIGGIITREIKQNEFKYFNWFIQVAHQNNCKIHGLGFTYSKLLKKYNFDTVDSTSWKSGGRFAQIHRFTGSEMNLKVINKKKYRVKDYKALDIFNFNEWCKYQKYMEEKQ